MLNGLNEGLATYWHPNGNLKRQKTYRAGKGNGTVTEWWENGQKKSEGVQEEARPVGLWQYWSEDGSCDILWDQDANEAVACP